MSVRVIDECELSSEWVEFTRSIRVTGTPPLKGGVPVTVIEQKRKRVHLLSPSGEKTWARVDEIVLSEQDLLTPNAAA